MGSPRTKPFSELVRSKIQRDPEFGRLLLVHSIEDFSRGDLVIGCEMLMQYIDATIGFEELGKALDKSPKSLRRMLADDKGICSGDLAAVIEHLKGIEGVETSVSVSASKPVGKADRKSAKEAAVA